VLLAPDQAVVSRRPNEVTATDDVQESAAALGRVSQPL
jgi:hypothetical protein